jgi:hypothetical protein
MGSLQVSLKSNKNTLYHSLYILRILATLQVFISTQILHTVFHSHASSTVKFHLKMYKNGNMTITVQHVRKGMQLLHFFLIYRSAVA